MTIFDRAFEQADDTAAVAAARRIAQKVLDNPRADDHAKAAARKVLNSDDVTVSRAIPRSVSPVVPPDPSRQREPTAPPETAPTPGSSQNIYLTKARNLRAGTVFISGHETAPQAGGLARERVVAKERAIKDVLKKAHLDSQTPKVIDVPGAAGLVHPGWYSVVVSYGAAAEVDEDRPGLLYKVAEEVDLDDPDFWSPYTGPISVMQIPIKKADAETGDDNTAD